MRLVFLDTCCATLFSVSVIESFKHRGLKRCFEQDDSRRLPRDMVERIKYIMTQLHAAEHIGDMDLHSFNLHELKGNRKGTWSVTGSENPPKPPFSKGGTGGELFNPFNPPGDAKRLLSLAPGNGRDSTTRIELHATHWAIDPNATPRTINSV